MTAGRAAEPSRPLSGVLVLACATLAWTTACAVPEAPAGSTVREPIWLVDVAPRARVSVTQIGGGTGGDHIIDTIGSGGAWLDYDGDGDADLYLAQGATQREPQGPPDRLLRNDGDSDGDGMPEFSDVTAPAGLGDREWSFGVAVADYDNDGDDDIFVANWGPDRLYRNNGNGTFTEIGKPAGVADPRWGVSAAWGDADRDGDLDLYVTHYVEFDFQRYPARGQPGRAGEPPCRWRELQVLCGPRNLEPARDVYYRNDGDPDGDGVPRFVDATREAGLLTARASYGLGVMFFDAEGDGDADLYVANDSVPSQFFVNRGDGTFREQGALSGLAYNEQGHEQASMGLATLDFDGNGRLDVIKTNFSHDHDTLYRNDGDLLFTDVSYPAGIGTPSYFMLGWGIATTDLDQDGWEDLFIARGHVYPQVDERDVGTTFRQRNGVFRGAGRRFEEITGRAGPGVAAAHSSRSVLPADLDGDGDLDLAVTNLNEPPLLLRNDGLKGHWLQVRLVGRRSSRDGIGARVILDEPPRLQVREITRSSSFAGSSLPVAHFGLGQARAATRLQVRWPSGKISVLTGVPADQLVRVEEPR
jgi:hypothetical protein